jgi:uncharacterized membrane protein
MRVLQGTVHLNEESIIQPGILLLIATPMTRVVFCVAGFARRKDSHSALISTTVLVILICILFREGDNAHYR